MTPIERHIAALSDKDAFVRASAAYDLGKIKDPSAVPALVAALSDKDAFVRWHVAWALNEIATDTPIPACESSTTH